jgi:hypothetical protein
MVAMRHRHKQRHFLVHTIEHLFGVLSIFVIALLLGVAGKSLHSPASGMLAQTGESIALSGTASSITTQSVVFGIERKAIDCSDGKSVGKYRFTISPETGGYIVVSTPLGSDNVYAGDSRGFDRYYQAGTYTWTASARTGFIGGGSGVFTVEDVCTSTATPTSNDDASVEEPSVPVALTASLVGVSFSAQPGPSATCGATGSPLTPVFLVVTKATGGEFLVSSNTGMNNAHFGWGEYYFPNGTYTWSAVVKSGFTGEGSLAGTFEVNNNCPESVVKESTNSPTGTTVKDIIVAPTLTSSAVTKTELPPLPRPQLHLFLDNIPTGDGRVFNKEQVEIRIATAIAEQVEVFATQGVGQSSLLGDAVKDDLLSRPGLDVWTLVVDMKSLPEGASKLHVRVRHTDERETLSERLSVAVKHPVISATTRTLVTSVPLPIADKESGGGIETSVRVRESDRASILARVSDPASCSSAEECRIYCKSLPGVNDLCVSFAQEEFASTLPRGESLVDGVSDVRLVKLLDGTATHAPEIPEFIVHPEDLKQYCAQSANTALCTKILVDNGLMAGDVLAKKAEHITQAEREWGRLFVERTGTRNFADTDADGVTDYDEVNMYHTDPLEIDTDKDGFADGMELLARTNPSGGVRVLTGTDSPTTSSTSVMTDESIALDNPKITGQIVPALLVVKSVEVTEVGTSTDGLPTAKKLKLAGVAMPNAFVTLYIFSEPIVVTVKADGAGAWVYTLDRELSDGTHEVYSTITDAGGRILAKSEPLPFIKVAAAVSLGETMLTSPESAPGFFTGPSLYAMIAILIGILGVALSLIGFVVKQKASDAADLPGI